MFGVYAVSFPKSGRTWIQMMIAKIYSEIIGSPIESILHHKHCGGLKRFWPRKNCPCVWFGHGYHNGRICQGNYFPKFRYWKRRVFLLVRNPRDVVVSHYYFSKWRDQAFDGSISEFIRYPFLNADRRSKQARFGIRPIINYMNAWLAHSSIFNDFHVAYYEDFKEDVEQQLRLLCDYIGIEVSDDIFEEAIAFGSFDNMRRLEVSGSINWYGLRGPNDLRAFKTRKGVVGGYKDELSQVDIDYINKEIGENLHQFFSRYEYS